TSANFAAEVGVGGAVDHAHAAAGQFALQDVTADDGARQVGRGGGAGRAGGGGVGGGRRGVVRRGRRVHGQGARQVGHRGALGGRGFIVARPWAGCKGRGQKRGQPQRRAQAGSPVRRSSSRG